MKRLIVFPFLLCIVCYASAQQRSNQISLSFANNSSLLMRDFRGNATALEQLDWQTSYYLTSTRIDSIVIVAYSSPEGDIVNNYKLSDERAKAVRSYIMCKHPYIDCSLIILHSRFASYLHAVATVVFYCNGQMVTSQYSQNYYTYYQQEQYPTTIPVYQHNTEVIVAPVQTAADHIEICPHCQEYQTDAVHYSQCPHCQEYRQMPQQQQRTIYIHQTDTIYRTKVDTIRIDNSSELVSKPLFALKTNLLMDAVTMLNIGLEVPLGHSWSISTELIFPWWLWESQQICIQNLSGNMELRYWFGKRSERPLLTGWFAGFYAGGGYYDFEWRTKGYQGEFYIAAGLSAGYAHTINKSGSLRMEYSLGVGYLRTNYREYIPQRGLDDKWHLIWQNTGKYSWFGPTTAKVSLVWFLNHGYEKRGGVR